MLEAGWCWSDRKEQSCVAFRFLVTGFPWLNISVCSSFPFVKQACYYKNCAGFDNDVFYFEKSSEVLMLFWPLYSYYTLIVIQMLGFLRMNLSSETSWLPSLFLWNIVWITEQLQMQQDWPLSSTSSLLLTWADRYTAYTACEETTLNILWFILGRKSVRVVLEVLTLKAWSVSSLLILCCSMYIMFSPSVLFFCFCPFYKSLHLFIMRIVKMQLNMKRLFQVWKDG